MSNPQAKVQVETTTVRSFSLDIPHKLVLKALFAVGYNIPEDAEITIDPSGCYCDSAPTLSKDHDLQVRWTNKQQERREE